MDYTAFTAHVRQISTVTPSPRTHLFGDNNIYIVFKVCNETFVVMPWESEHWVCAQLMQVFHQQGIFLHMSQDGKSGNVFMQSLSEHMRTFSCLKLTHVLWPIFSPKLLRMCAVLNMSVCIGPCVTVEQCCPLQTPCDSSDFDHVHLYVRQTRPPAKHTAWCVPVLPWSYLTSPNRTWPRQQKHVLHTAQFVVCTSWQWVAVIPDVNHRRFIQKLCSKLLANIPRVSRTTVSWLYCGKSQAQASQWDGQLVLRQ